MRPVASLELTFMFFDTHPALFRSAENLAVLFLIWGRSLFRFALLAGELIAVFFAVEQNQSNVDV